MCLSICFSVYCCYSYPSQKFSLLYCFCFIFFKRARTGATAATQKNLCIINNWKEFLSAFCVVLGQITFSLKLRCEMPFVMLQLIKESKTSIVIAWQHSFIGAFLTIYGKYSSLKENILSLIIFCYHEILIWIHFVLCFQFCKLFHTATPPYTPGKSLRM